VGSVLIQGTYVNATTKGLREGLATFYTVGTLQLKEHNESSQESEASLAASWCAVIYEYSTGSKAHQRVCYCEWLLESVAEGPTDQLQHFLAT
jgi:hypothetical protein